MISLKKEKCRYLVQDLLVWWTKAICGMAVYKKDGGELSVSQTIYFANHTSHLDFLAIWSSLPKVSRVKTRPIAAADYWNKSPLRHFLSSNIFQAILIDRSPAYAKDPLWQVREALGEGYSIIIFPEGTRGTDNTIGNFKSGLYSLAKDFWEVPLVPVFLYNLNRILPKGECLAVPLLSRIVFGPSLKVQDNENKEAFLLRMKAALEDLSL